MVLSKKSAAAFPQNSGERATRANKEGLQSTNKHEFGSNRCRWLGVTGVGVVGMKREGLVREGEWECLLELTTKHHYESIRRENDSGGGVDHNIMYSDDGEAFNDSDDEWAVSGRGGRGGHGIGDETIRRRFDSYASYNGTYHIGTGALDEFAVPTTEMEAEVAADTYNEDDHFILPFKKLSLYKHMNRRGSVDTQSSKRRMSTGGGYDWPRGNQDDSFSDADSGEPYFLGKMPPRKNLQSGTNQPSSSHV